jgi:hypothetical protein
VTVTDAVHQYHLLHKRTGGESAALSAAVDGSAILDHQPASEEDPAPEEVFYEGSGCSNVELAVSLLLGVVTLIYLPLTMASLGRRVWINVSSFVMCTGAAAHRLWTSIVECVARDLHWDRLRC